MSPDLWPTNSPQQSASTAGRSIINATLALRLPSELCVAFIDIKSAFDSVDRRALWKVLWCVPKESRTSFWTRWEIFMPTQVLECELVVIFQAVLLQPSMSAKAASWPQHYLWCISNWILSRLGLWDLMLVSLSNEIRIIYTKYTEYCW